MINTRIEIKQRILADTVYIFTLGCPKNEADSRSLARLLQEFGLLVLDDPEEASYILINTCGFIQDAKEESIGAILEACASYGGERVVVTGCLVERYREELSTGIPEVAAWFGLSEMIQLASWLKNNTHDGSLMEAPNISESTSGGPLYFRADSDTKAISAYGSAYGLAGNRNIGVAKEHGLSVHSSSYAYLKISDGCNARCTFCAIPHIKGPYYSLAAEQILEEAKACLAVGAKELILVGQDTAIWSQGKMGLTDLIDQIAADERVRRVRLMYLQPEHVSDELLNYMAAQKKLCHYLDIPFQHSEAQILRRMGRSGSADSYLELLEKARRLMPDVSVRSTFIVGFPGETEAHFEALMDFLSEAKFDHAGGFIYSPEEGTSAENLSFRVSESVARDRLAHLNAFLAAEAEQQRHHLLESQVEVIIDLLKDSLEADEIEEGFIAVGRTKGQAPEIDGVTYLKGSLPEICGPGDVVTVEVTDIMAYDLVGRFVKDNW